PGRPARYGAQGDRVDELVEQPRIRAQGDERAAAAERDPLEIALVCEDTHAADRLQPAVDPAALASQNRVRRRAEMRRLAEHAPAGADDEVDGLEQGRERD